MRAPGAGRRTGGFWLVAVAVGLVVQRHLPATWAVLGAVAVAVAVLTVATVTVRAVIDLRRRP